MSILSIQRRQREIGRLRLGTKDADRGFPKSLSTWRLTSPSKELLDHAATMYGGTVTKWQEQWEVVTQAASLPVMIPKQEIRQDMELWSKGGLVRRCDGQTALVATKEEGVFLEQPCLCADQGDEEPSCKPSTLLKFWLPDIPGLGVWVLSSTGWNVASELAADVEMLAGKNVRAKLSIDHRERKVAGQTKKFVVPVLDIPVSLSELMAGGFNPAVASLPPPPPDTGKESAFVSLPMVGEEPNETGGGGNTIGHVADDGPLSEIAARAIERYWVDLRALIDSGPPEGTMEDMEVGLRSLFRLSERVGVVKSGERALHAALEKRGAKHVADLKKAELAALCKDAWAWAKGQVDAESV